MGCTLPVFADNDVVVDGDSSSLGTDFADYWIDIVKLPEAQAFIGNNVCSSFRNRFSLHNLISIKRTLIRGFFLYKLCFTSIIKELRKS